MGFALSAFSSLPLGFSQKLPGHNLQFWFNKRGYALDITVYLFNNSGSLCESDPYDLAVEGKVGSAVSGDSTDPSIVDDMDETVGEESNRGIRLKVAFISRGQRESNLWNPDFLILDEDALSFSELSWIPGQSMIEPIQIDTAKNRGVTV